MAQHQNFYLKYKNRDMLYIAKFKFHTGIKFSVLVIKIQISIKHDNRDL